MSKAETVQSARTDFMRKEGFLMFTEANLGLLDDITASSPLNKVDPPDFLEYTQPASIESSLAFYAVVRHITEESVYPEILPEKTPARINQTSDDEEAIQQHTLIRKIGDQEFPWYFSAGVANAVALEFVESGALTKEEYANISLTDWATMISSEWFRKLMHSMAFTSNGIWAQFGSGVYSYHPGALWKKVESKLKPRLYTVGTLTDSTFSMLEVQDRLEPSEGKVYKTAKLHPEIKRVLIQEMRRERGGSVGCPVARLACRVSIEELENPRVMRLLGRGLLTAEEGVDDTVVLRQEMTAIDRTLILFAKQLIGYDRTHGTPQYTSVNNDGTSCLYTWKGHAFIPATNVFGGESGNTTFALPGKQGNSKGDALYE